MILLLGATGYIGLAFAAELRRRGLAFAPLSRAILDYTRFDALFNYARRAQTTLIINAAGYTGRPNVDACETARAETVRANTLLPQTVARVCYLTNIAWAHVSSGGIYSGAKIARDGGLVVERNLNRPELRHLFDSSPDCFCGFMEADPPNFSFRSPPCNFYSGTKALAEEALRWFDRGYIWRPRLVFDGVDHPRNLLSKLRRYPKIHDSLNSLSHRGDFVGACLDLWQSGAPFGTYNIVNPGAISIREVAEAVRCRLRPELPCEFWESDEEFYRFGAKTPRTHGILDTSKLQSAGIRLRSAREALQDSLDKWQPSANEDAWVEQKSNVPVIKSL